MQESTGIEAFACLWGRTFVAAVFDNVRAAAAVSPTTKHAAVLYFSILLTSASVFSYFSQCCVRVV